MGRARDLANILSSSGNVALDSELGLSLITPTSIANTGGSASISSTGAVSFTSASAISLNGCFTSTYDNYRVIFTLSSVSANNGMNFRLRASGSDASSTDYYAGGTINRANSATVSSQNIGAGTTFELGPSGTAHPSNRCIIDFLNPFSSLYTGVHISTAGFDSGTSHYGRYVAGNYIATTSFDGFTFYPTTGNITGTIRVYGYRN
jgi:hypothetical protein